MRPASGPRQDPSDQKLLVIETAGARVSVRPFAAFEAYLAAGDVIVVNDAATLPASIPYQADDGRVLEARLASRERDGTFWVILFGPGDHRVPTEKREVPAPALVGTKLQIAGTEATVVEVSPESSRRVRVTFPVSEENLYARLYASGRAVQYAYVPNPVALWDVQTAYGSRPWAVEMPSAGRPLTWELLLRLRTKGVHIVPITHAAGLSSTGDPVLDAQLPWPEAYEISQDAAAAIQGASGRVIAVGTSVVRALEASAVDTGRIAGGSGTAELILSERSVLNVVDGMLTGMHEKTASHFALLRAFAPSGLIQQAYDAAEGADFLCHEFGDSTLILAA